ncbi:MAG TPA: Uma2 family endonuclease [Planctomycetaceae bacterium]
MDTKTELRLGMADHGVKLTREEFGEAQYEEPWRYERVGGKLVVMSPAGHDHQIPHNLFRDYLGAYKLAHPEIVEFVFSEVWICTTKSTDRIADIGVFLVAAKSKGTIPERAPDLAFEFVSGGGDDRKRDFVEKRAEYLRAGIREYVIVDRFDDRVTVLRRVRGRFVGSNLGPADTYTSPLLPGLKIPLKEAL